MTVLSAKKSGPNNEVTALPGRKVRFHCNSYFTDLYLQYWFADKQVRIGPKLAENSLK